MSDDPEKNIISVEENPVVKEYIDNRNKYEEFSINVSNLLGTLCRSKGIEVLQIEKRVKEYDSIISKLTRPEKQGKYKELSDITDIAGVRIITYYKSDVEKIQEIIEEVFDVDYGNSVNKMYESKPNQFGYLSVHYVLKYKNNRISLEENRGFRGLKVEVQVRTVLQHAWAVLDRRMRYNSRMEVPKAIQRRLFRVGAFLEGADDDLSDVEAKILLLRESYKKDVETGQYKMELNRDSLLVFLEDSSTSTKILNDIKSLGWLLSNPFSQKSANSLSTLLGQLQSMKIESLEDLDKILSPLADRAKEIFQTMHRNHMMSQKMSAYGICRILLCYVEDDEISATAIENSGFKGTGWDSAIVKTRASLKK